MATSKKTSKPSKVTKKTSVKKTSSKNVKKKIDNDWLARSTQKRVQVFTKVITITVGTIIIFGGAGWLIDHYIGTKPAFLIILVIASFPVTQILLYKKIKQITKK